MSQDQDHESTGWLSTEWVLSELPVFIRAHNKIDCFYIFIPFNAAFKIIF